mgnify:CR=1 FL=1
MTAHKYADILVAIAQGKAISRLIGSKVIDLTPTEALNFIVQDVGGFTDQA